MLSSINCFSQQQDQVTMMSYNLLDYPTPGNVNGDTALRNPYYRITIAAANPDIVVVCEMNSQFGINSFLSKVMNAATASYAAGTFIDGPDTDNGIFYKSSKFTFISNKKIKTDLRDINEFKLVHLLSGDTIRIYAVHLKASSGTSEETQRALEIDSLRKVTNKLPAGSNFIVCGDFNFYNSSEPGYQKLLQVTAGNEGYFVDPVTMTGTWNAAQYAIHHTQSTRTRAFGGGSTGGMDDRFDLILYSHGISQAGGVTYVSNSEIAYGNDGNHYNDSINKMPNTAVLQTVANALCYASDHVPVIAKFNFQYGTASLLPDLGVQALISPLTTICPTSHQSIQVQIKNFGSDTVKFSSSNLQVALQATNPAAALQTFSKTIATGSIAGGGTMNITFDSTYNMNAAGNYSFTANTLITGDANPLNNSMAPVTVVVTPVTPATITPAGPISICSGSSATLTASSGTSFLWSTGATTGAITVTDSGKYAVTVTNANGCASVSPLVSVSVVGSQTGTVFTETIGSVSATTSIASHETNNGFDNDNYTMSGSGDVRNTQTSLGSYTGASGGANVFLTNSAGKNFVISGINTSGLATLQLSFGVFKSTTASNGSDLMVQVSGDGVNYTNLSFPSLTTGSGSAMWYYRTASGTIPATANLRIQFIQNGIATQYRIDDVSLKYSGSIPLITAAGATTICNGETVTLNTTGGAGQAYQWKKDGSIISGATNQSFAASAAGSYTCDVSTPCSINTSNAIAVAVNNCASVLDLTVIIQGYYLGAGMMRPALFYEGVDPNPLSSGVDTIKVELHRALAPYNLDAGFTGVLQTNGHLLCTFPGNVSGNQYYIVVKGKNMLETWSAAPHLMTASSAYNFTSGVGQAYPDINNLFPQMKEVESGVWALYSGDVNQDQSIDGSDFNTTEPDVTQGSFGYFSTDINGDGPVDGGDFNLLELNVGLGLFVAHP